MSTIELFFMLTCMHCTYAAQFSEHLIDLTHPFDNYTLHHPSQKKFQINVVPNKFHKDDHILMEDYSSGTHVGTHMDSPVHFKPGKWSIDEIPLDRLIAPAAVIDIERQCESNPDYQMTVGDLIDWENRMCRMLNDVIVLVKTGWSKRWGNSEQYYGINDMETEYRVESLHFPGISGEAANWLVKNRNIIGIGIDSLSLDSGTAPSFIAHKTFLENNIYGLENLANLNELPLFGAKLYVMPMKIRRGRGAPARVVASY